MRHRGLALDLGLCAVLLAWALPPALDPAYNGDATTWGPMLLPLLLVPIPLARRSPPLAAGAFVVAAVLSGVPTFDQFRLLVAVPAALVVAFALGRGQGRRAAVAWLGALIAGLAFVGASDHQLHGPGGVAGMLGFAVPLCALVWGAGRAVRDREALAAELGARTRALEARREATAAMAVELDRVRLACDLDAAARLRLHEMVALARAGVAAPARAPFGAIEELGREALDGMRGLLGLLRSDQQVARGPLPTLDALEGLLAETRAGGRAVALEVDGDRRPLAAGVELAAFRGLQHALAAVTGDARVRLGYVPGALELEVRGARAAAGAALSAARERVTASGGTFIAEPDGVRARLPAGEAAHHG